MCVYTVMGLLAFDTSPGKITPRLPYDDDDDDDDDDEDLSEKSVGRKRTQHS